MAIPYILHYIDRNLSKLIHHNIGHFFFFFFFTFVVTTLILKHGTRCLNSFMIKFFF